jgi:ribosomal-protein-alanine N-acetyltransferase
VSGRRVERAGAAPAIAVHLETPSLRRADAFLVAVRRSRALHGRLVSPPRTRKQFRAWVSRSRRPSHVAHLVCRADGELVGVVNINEIVRGALQSGYLGYYALVPHHGRGYMTAGLGLVVARAFGRHRLHRLEANIQPGNLRSIALVKRLGFRLEGVSPRYLRIARRWRDHERWALTVEDWGARPPVSRSTDRHRRSARG